LSKINNMLGTILSVADLFRIIPQITSPLAVICFAFAIVYLIKRGNDKVKETSLNVTDPAAQQDAVKRVLSNHPNIELQKITDPIAARELAEQIIHDSLKKHTKNLNTALSFTAIFAATFLLSLLIPKWGKPSTSSDSTTIKIDTLYSWAEKEAQKEGLTYALNSVVQHIKLTDILGGSIRNRKAEFRNHYLVSALKNITSADHVFVEQFLTNNARVEPLPGSEEQTIESIAQGIYWVKFELPTHERKPILTAANYYYSIPLTAAGSNDCFGSIVNGTSEWLTCYPNTTDYIDKLTIIIEADNLDINRPNISAYRKNRAGGIITSDALCKTYLNQGHCMLVATWSKISPGECLGLKINWSAPK
jgi:hypothetical protein